jgi:hypothetical protein
MRLILVYDAKVGINVEFSLQNYLFIFQPTFEAEKIGSQRNAWTFHAVR